MENEVFVTITLKMQDDSPKNPIVLSKKLDLVEDSCASMHVYSDLA